VYNLNGLGTTLETPEIEFRYRPKLRVLRGSLNSNCSEVSRRHADGRRPHTVHMMWDGAMKSGSSKRAES